MYTVKKSRQRVSFAPRASRDKENPIKLTANLERNRISIQAYLAESDARNVYDALLDVLLDNLEHFPDMGRLFMQRPSRSVEMANVLAKLRQKLQGGELRE